MKKSNLTTRHKDVFLEIERNRNLLLSTPHTVFYKFNRSSLNYSYFSPSIEELTGYSKDELKELGFNRALHEEVTAGIEQEEKESNPDNAYFSRYWIETKKGSWKLIENHAFNDNNETNNTVSGFLRDVTSLNDYILELLHEKDKLNAIIDLAEVIIVVLDKFGNVELINKKTCDILGCDKETIKGKNWFDSFISPEHKEGLKEYFNLVLEGSEEISETYENPIVTKYGEVRDIFWHNKVFNDEKGEFLFMLSSGEDVTEKRYEEKIQKVISDILQASNSGSKLDEFFEYIHQSIGKLMPAENFYIALHDKTTDMISFPYSVDKYDPSFPSKKFGNGLTEYILRNGESALITKEMDDELVNKGETKIYGTQSAIWLGIPLKIGDFTIGALVVQDYDKVSTYTEKEKGILEVIAYSISRAIERKRLEQERSELIKKLEKLNSSKDKLFSLVSHDLRSPFNSLLGFSEILTSEYDTLTTEEIKEYIKAIYDSSKNLFGMTNNLLQYSRFQMGKIEFQPEVLNLKDIIESSLKILKGNIVKKQLNLVQEVDENINVYADEDMLSSIIQNLISNAVKFTDKKGDVKISTEIIPSGDKNKVARVTVTDSGVGISSTDIKRILEGDVYTTPGTEKEFGTGLGLQLVKEFIHKNNGMLDINSKLSKGSSFIFTLPLKK